MKRTKYSNGGGTKQEVHANVQAIEDRFASQQRGDSFGRGSVRLPAGFTASGSIFKNKDIKVKDYTLEKNIGKKVNVGVTTGTHGEGVSLSAGNFRFNINKSKNGATNYGIRYFQKI